MVDTFDEPVNGEAMGVCTTREVAEEFVPGDPLVVNGVVASSAAQTCQEVLAP